MLHEVLSCKNFFEITVNERTRHCISHDKFYKKVGIIVDTADIAKIEANPKVILIINANILIQRIGALAYPLALFSIILFPFLSDIRVACLLLLSLAIAWLFTYSLNNRFDRLKSRHGSTGILQKMFGLGMFLDE
jgi:hypothetical protein